jgi:hypothetical protein
MGFYVRYWHLADVKIRDRCPLLRSLLGAMQTSQFQAVMSANDP